MKVGSWKTWKGQALHYIPIYMEIDLMEIVILPLQQEGGEHLGIMQSEARNTFGTTAAKQ